ncbi:MAG: hypothetical protein RL095_3199 [Verrucomicrobiota bacterium]|jgi:endonuclease YncB( thermonuclease family)
MKLTRSNLLLLRSVIVLVVIIGAGIGQLVSQDRGVKPARPQDDAAERTSGPTADSKPSREPQSSSANPREEGQRRIKAFCYDVADGDTLRLKDEDGATIKLRLKGIDAPEFRPLQAHGDISRQALLDKIKGKQIEVLLVSKDQYERDLGVAYYQGINLNEEQVRLGNAWSYAYKRDPEFARMKALEQEARVAKKGLWALPNPQNPRQFRDSQPKK